MMKILIPLFSGNVVKIGEEVSRSLLWSVDNDDLKIDVDERWFEIGEREIVCYSLVMMKSEAWCVMILWWISVRVLEFFMLFKMNQESEGSENWRRWRGREEFSGKRSQFVTGCYPFFSVIVFFSLLSPNSVMRVPPWNPVVSLVNMLHVFWFYLCRAGYCRISLVVFLLTELAGFSEVSLLYCRVLFWLELL